MPRTYRVRLGECLLSVAARSGFADWKVIYEYPDNAALKRERRFPPMLAPHDEVSLPKPRLKELALPTGKAHKIRIERAQARLRLGFVVEPGTAAELAVGGENVGTSLQADALVEVPIEADTARGSLSIRFTDELGERPLHMELAIGELHAPESLIGLQARLANLGHYFGAVDGHSYEATQPAIARFQIAHGLPVTGDGDEDTVEAVRRAHDGS
jgi:hypothetical protein